MDLASVQTFIVTRGLDFGLQVIASIALWIFGRWAIRIVTNLMGKLIRRSGKVDSTLSHYLESVVSVLLTVLLILAILQVFGVQTTSFAALLAGLGLAVGTAWGGLLAHFAAGVFMQVLRPFKVGDVISAGGVTGTVKELGLFGTTIVTADNVVTLVGNNKIFSDNIANYSATPTRRVDLTAKIANGVDAADAIKRLKAALELIPNVVKHPAPDVGVLSFTPEGPLLFVRPSTQPPTTGKCIATPIARFSTRSARPAIRRRKRRSRIARPPTSRNPDAAAPPRRRAMTTRERRPARRLRMRPPRPGRRICIRSALFVHIGRATAATARSAGCDRDGHASRRRMRCEAHKKAWLAATPCNPSRRTSRAARPPEVCPTGGAPCAPLSDSPASFARPTCGAAASIARRARRGSLPRRSRRARSRSGNDE